MGDLETELSRHAPGASVEAFGSSLFGMDSEGSDLDAKVVHPGVDILAAAECALRVPGVSRVETVTPARTGSESYLLVTARGGSVDLFVNPSNDTLAVWADAVDRIPHGRFAAFAEGVRFMKGLAMDSRCYGSLEMGINGVGMLSRCLSACESRDWPADLTGAMLSAFSRAGPCVRVECNPRCLFSVNATFAGVCREVRSRGEWEPHRAPWKVRVTVYGAGAKSVMASGFGAFVEMQRTATRPRCTSSAMTSNPDSFVVEFRSERLCGVSGSAPRREALARFAEILGGCSSRGSAAHWGLEVSFRGETETATGTFKRKH
jgi:hypothetical protein